MNVYESDSIPFLLSRVMRLHRNRVHGLIQDYEVHPGQPPLLHHLAEQDGQRQSELADKLRVKPATLTVMINRMAKMGLLERRPDPQDQRISRVYLTDKGRLAHEAVREALREMEQVTMARISPEEKLLLRRLLLQMYENLQEPNPD
ncbi:MarR family winged helix-turn-helix transcriptional regulator [Paenibacillus mucilaginosus]|uniref:Putative transcriptional regulator n=1 Tax=Paenibacillus mucilaginosus (strain KNP414) TaxID=1036673 RepID=F8FGY7_PAEMK|nr:MarR family transcriptional regulator [Paenibacillus mucilaginosus]AEI46288.1 putative transcriptional regulator [Paenibacillus mucilaginosus KNP414]MCG7213597.1 MarR family transcriptional regulator [Paenibacillus mucilaginosus]WDM27588.1 MarR family transcriptional regulator [Paenibacillus mucilaginosus]